MLLSKPLIYRMYNLQIVHGLFNAFFVNVRRFFRRLNQRVVELPTLLRLLVAVTTSYVLSYTIMTVGNIILIGGVRLLDTYFFTGLYAAVQEDTGFATWGQFGGTYLLGVVGICILAYVTSYLLYGLGVGYVAQLCDTAWGGKFEGIGSSAQRRTRLDYITFIYLFVQLTLAWVYCLYQHGLPG